MIIFGSKGLAKEILTVIKWNGDTRPIPFFDDIASDIGEGCLINKVAIISHDVHIGSYCEISPGARILGRAYIGDCTEIGSKAVVLPDIRVGNNCKVGAGAVVTKNVPDNHTVVGITARPISSSTN